MHECDDAVGGGLGQAWVLCLACTSATPGLTMMHHGSGDHSKGSRDSWGSCWCTMWTKVDRVEVNVTMYGLHQFRRFCRVDAGVD
jgi:hypothetical protein